jgi:hypothetical protein
LNDAIDARQLAQLRQVFKVIKEMYPSIWQQTIVADLSKLVNSMRSPAKLARVVNLIVLDSEIWTSLEPAEKVKVSTFIENLPTDQIHQLDTWLLVPVLRRAAVVRAKRMTYAELDTSLLLFFSVDPVARSYESANSWGRIASQMADSFTVEEIATIFKAASENDEIRGSFQWTHLANELKGNKVMSKDKFNALMVTYEFQEFMHARARKGRSNVPK